MAVPGGASPELAEEAEKRGLRVSPFMVEPDGPSLRRIAELIDVGEVGVEVERVFPLEQAGAAHVQGEAGRTRGKLVLKVGG